MKLDEKTVVYNFDELWTSYSGDRCGVFFLSQRDISILVSALRFAGWRSRWVGGDNPDWPRDLLRNQDRLEDLETALTYIDGLLEVLMSDCGANFAFDGLYAIAQAILNKPCCSGDISISVIQEVTTGGNTVYGTQTPGGLSGPAGEGDPPEGFASWSEYYTHKCALANSLADGFSDSLSFLSTVSLVNLVALASLLGVHLGIVALFPPSAIPVVIGALIAMGASLGVLNTLSGWLVDNKQDVVCALYNSENVQDAVDALIAVVATGLTALGISASLHPTITTIVLALANTDNLNALFDANVNLTYPDADCSDCEELPCGWTVALGSIVSREELSAGRWQVTFGSAPNTDYFDRQEIHVRWDGVDPGFWWENGSESMTIGAPIGANFYRCDLSALARSAINDSTGGASNIYRGFDWWGLTPGTYFEYTVTVNCDACP